MDSIVARRMILFKHQQEFLDRNRNRDLCAHGTGLGKSLIIQRRLPTLIICPKGLVTKWEEEFPDAVVVSKETFRTGWKKLPPHDNVAVDESHYFHTQTSGLFKALNGYLKKHRTTYLTLATATPHRKSPWNLYAVGILLGYDWDYIAFRKKYFQQVFVGWKLVNGVKTDKYVWQPNLKMEGEVQRVWRKVGHFIQMSEVTDMPKEIVRVEEIPLTTEQKKAIKYTFDPVPIVENNTLHQIEQGVVKGSGYQEAAYYKTGKTERVLEFAYEFPKLIVVCQFTAQIDMINKALKKEGYTTIVISGQSKESHDVLAKRADSLDKCVVIIQAQVGAGFELPSFPTMVFASMNYDLVNWVQMIGRHQRINALHSVLRVYLVSGGIDRAVYDSIIKKQDFNLKLYAK